MTKKKEKPQQVSFESALGALNDVVKSMESGTMPLSELVAKYEEGVRYLRICEAQLKHADMRVQQIKESMVEPLA
jgi:exodeoxyribonuclease VII small subunit